MTNHLPHETIALPHIAKVLRIAVISDSHTATFTFLFTDIEGSTRLWEQESEQMRSALASHNALSRTAVEGNRGTVVKMTGDGVYAAFADGLDAVNATLQLQQALPDLEAANHVPLQVRCGLHLGAAERSDNDFFGRSVNRAARIMSAAHGGQVLVSQAVADDVRHRLPPPVSLKDLGSVRLKDLAGPEHVYQVLHPELRRDFPALRSLEATPNNLPQHLTSFIGREREQREAKALLENTRLLTLLGMGGLGKTRLSMQIAADLMDASPDGVWFVDLAPIRDPSLVPDTTAQVLGLREEPGKPLTQTLCAHLRRHKALLILDNCEHVVGACASLANVLLRAAPDVRIIATSRESLRVPGEQTYPVLPLAVPERSAGIETLSRFEAVQLFVERAQLQRSGFSLTEREAPAIAELCARLEGIPLALELAAARMRSLSIQDINQRLDDRFKLLTGGGRVLLERQQTLRALVAWSYDLLPEPEQRLLERLSVFAGGFDLEAAENVCGAEPLAPEDILDLETSLVEKSLVMAVEGGNGSRYRQLETIREFAREYLGKGDDAAVIAARHCDYFLSFAKIAKRKLDGGEQAEWTRRLEVELDNLRAAIALALAGGVDPVIAVKFEVALMRFRILRGYSTEGRNNVRAALLLPGIREPNAARAHALYTGGVLAEVQSDKVEATEMLAECLAIRRNLGQPRETAAALSTLSTIYLRQGDAPKARDYEEEALGIFRELGDQIGEAIGLLNLGEISMQLADDGNAAELFEQCLALARSIKHLELESDCERNLGELALSAGNLQGAQSRFARSLNVCRDAEDKRGEAITLWCLGKADTASGDHESARKKLFDALRSFQAFGMNSEALDCLEDYAELLRITGRVDDSVRLQAAATAVRVALALRRSARGESKERRNIEAARAALGDAAFDSAWSGSQAWGLGEAIKHALALAADSRVTA